MRYYHGTDVYFKEFILSYSGTRKDFGVGVYLSEGYKHAESIAVRKKGLVGYVYTYNVALTDIRSLFKVKEFRGASVEWVKFIIANRSMQAHCDADIVMGPTADAATNTLIYNFIHWVEKPTDEDYKKLASNLRASTYSNQICLKTVKAIDYFNKHRIGERRVK